jgi:hypothetical protein
MIVTLKQETFEDIRKNGKFTSDGCACGDFTYRLDDKLWLTVYRSCRKSSMTPDEKLWQLHDIQFYDNVEFYYFERDGITYVDDIKEYGNLLENVKLNKFDEQLLYQSLSIITKETWGNEYRNEY